MRSITNFFIFSLLVLSGKAEKLIIDADAGADDAVAILMLLRAEASNESPYEVVGITCTYGNTKEENVERNVIRTLNFANRTDIPVYGGAKRPLLLGNFTTDSFFGKDGFGDSTKLDNSIDKTIESTHASLAMIELAKKHEGNISIVVLGPTTNVALAASLDGNFISRVKKFYVMGSSVAGWGNYKANVEFNFGADPESNFILLSLTNSSQLTLLPWETLYNAPISKDWRLNVLSKKISSFINTIENVSLRTIQDRYIPADSINVITMLWPHVVKSSIETYVQAVTDGAARGSVLVNYPRFTNLIDKPPNAKIIQSVDVELCKEAFVYYLSCDRIPC